MSELTNPCPTHPSKPLAGTCSRCAKPICIDCAPELATHPEEACADCQAVMAAGRKPPAELSSLLGYGACGFAAVYSGLALYGGGTWGIFFGATLCVALGIAFARSKSAGYAWLLSGVEGACLGHLFELLNWEFLFLLGLMPIFTVYYVRFAMNEALASVGLRDKDKVL